MITEVTHAPFTNSVMSVSRGMRNVTDGGNIPWWLHKDWLETYQAYVDVGSLIFVYSLPVVLVLGVFGNFMIIVIMFRLPEASLGIWFHCLAWCDQLALLTNALYEWLYEAFKVPYFDSLGSWPCKVERVLTYAVPVVSSWSLVALTMLRAASVLWPHRIGAVWTKRQSRIAVVVLIVVVLLMHAHFFYGIDYDEDLCSTTITKCCISAVSKTYQWFFLSVWSWVSLLQLCFLPFVFLVISNSVLLWKLVGSVRANRQLSVQQSTQDSRQQKVSSLSVTLMTVSAAFLLLTTPVSVYFIMYTYILEIPDPVVHGQFFILYSISTSLWYANSAINFYLYCLTGSKFRAEFWNVVTECFSLCRNKQRVKTEPRSIPPSVTSSSPVGGVGVDVRNGKRKNGAVTDSDF